MKTKYGNERNNNHAVLHKIKKTSGLFVGEILGLGFFEKSPEGQGETPVEFESQQEAQSYLDSWVGGPSDCSVVEEK